VTILDSIAFFPSRYNKLLPRIFSFIIAEKKRRKKKAKNCR